MIFQSSQNPNSHLTIKERKWPSYPTKQLYSRGLIHGRVLDFGCGDGIDVAYLSKHGLDCNGYDPHYASEYPQGKFDTILCIYVLNVLLPEEQSHVLMAISEQLKPSGKAYFAVRRDLKRSGFRTHVKHGIKTYQCNVVLPFKSVLRTEHCEVYEYQHYNQLNHNVQCDCPFCTPDTERELLTESATAYAILDKFPVSPGHTLVIPKQHTASYFDLPEKSKTACWIMTERVEKLLRKRFLPDGLNIGINIGNHAGQTIPHVHIHLIPRYTGDIENPTGGVRNVIPGKGDYSSPNSNQDNVQQN
jgi:ATP adenylyltransferase